VSEYQERFNLQQTLGEIVTNIEFVRKYIGTLAFDEFVDNDEKVQAVLHRLQSASEAARRISSKWKDVAQGMQERHPKVKWQNFRDLSNVYRHGYDIIDYERLWEDLAPGGLISCVEEAMHHEFPLVQIPPTQ
jgi:uncharacterized protein with HEPN domain